LAPIGAALLGGSAIRGGLPSQSQGSYGNARMEPPIQALSVPAFFSFGMFIFIADA
jgi:hypothetical protein